MQFIYNEKNICNFYLKRSQKTFTYFCTCICNDWSSGMKRVGHPVWCNHVCPFKMFLCECETNWVNCLGTCIQHIICTSLKSIYNKSKRTYFWLEYFLHMQICVELKCNFYHQQMKAKVLYHIYNSILTSKMTLQFSWNSSKIQLKAKVLSGQIVHVNDIYWI